MPVSDWTKIISASVTPVVIISACSLLCLAFYNRLAAIVSRLRGFQRERLQEQQRVAHAAPGDEADAELRRRLLEHLKNQTAQVTRRAKLIRWTLFFLLLTIAIFVICCLMLGLSNLLPATVLIAVPLFVLGLCSMFTATIFAMLELKAALHPAELESRFVSDMVAESEIDQV